MPKDVSNQNTEELIIAIGRTIRTIREQQNISQAQLAFEAGIPRNQISRIERGEINTTIRTLHAISMALNIRMQEIYFAWDQSNS